MSRRQLDAHPISKQRIMHTREPAHISSLSNIQRSRDARFNSVTMSFATSCERLCVNTRTRGAASSGAKHEQPHHGMASIQRADSPGMLDPLAVTGNINVAGYWNAKGSKDIHEIVAARVEARVVADRVGA